MTSYLLACSLFEHFEESSVLHKTKAGSSRFGFFIVSDLLSDLLQLISEMVLAVTDRVNSTFLKSLQDEQHDLRGEHKSK